MYTTPLVTKRHGNKMDCTNTPRHRNTRGSVFTVVTKSETESAMSALIAISHSRELFDAPLLIYGAGNPSFEVIELQCT